MEIVSLFGKLSSCGLANGGKLTFYHRLRAHKHGLVEVFV